MLQRLVAFLFLLLLLPFVMAFGDEDFLMPDEAFKLHVDNQSSAIIAKWTIAEGYYLYKDKFIFKSETQGVRLGTPEFPQAKSHFGILPSGEEGDVDVYFNEVSIRVPVIEGDAKATFLIQSQGCAERGLCYPPQKKRHQLKVAAAQPVIEKADAAGTDINLGNSLGGDLSLGNLLGSNSLGFGQDELLTTDQAFQVDAYIKDTNRLKLEWFIAPNTYLYAEKFQIQLEGDLEAGDYQMPRPERKWGLRVDGSEGDVDVYHDRVSLEIPLIRSNNQALPFKVKLVYQGCEKKIGVCYPPVRKTLDLMLPTVSAATLPGKTPPQVTEKGSIGVIETAKVKSSPQVKPVTSVKPERCDHDAGAKETFSGKGFWGIVFFFFVIGAGLSLTPCVFPMIPILSGIITGQKEVVTPMRGFILSLVYVLAMALTYTFAGIIAAKSGENLQVALQSPIALSLFALLFVALALSMFGFYEIQLPSALQGKITELSNKQSGGNYTGVAIMGFLSALIVGPCVAPPLAASLVYIGQTGDVALGGMALFAMSIGMGLPLLLLGASAGKILPKAGGWMDAVKVVFGVAMLGIAITMLERLAPTYIPGYLPMILWGLLLVGSAIYLGALEPFGQMASGWKKLWKALGVALLIWGVVVLIGAARGYEDPLQPLVQHEKVAFKRITTSKELEAELAAARTAGKPVLLDFYADWCVYCKTMEREIFPHPLVEKQLKQMLLLKADVTSNTELLEYYGLVAPPTVLLFDSKGVELCDDRIIGNVTVDQLLTALNKVK